ncbi:MAG: hypothetical protein QM753_10470 [Thermomicrobiales bacterium]
MTGIKQQPNVEVTKPASRHYITQVGKGSKSRPGDRNTIIDPWVDVQADIDAINRGDAYVDIGKANAWINGRFYGYHSDTGTAWPISGEGFIELDQRQYSALKKVAEYNGLNTRSERYLTYEPNLTDRDRDLIRDIWRMREQAKANT